MALNSPVLLEPNGKKEKQRKMNAEVQDICRREVIQEWAYLPTSAPKVNVFNE